MKLTIGVSNLSVLFPDGMELKIPQIQPWEEPLNKFKSKGATKRIILPGTKPVRYVDINITAGVVAKAISLSKDEGISYSMVQTLYFDSEAVALTTKKKGPKVKIH